MEFQELVKERRSVRKYDPDRKITKEEVRTLLKEVQYAPSWKNFQPARFHCILDPDKLAAFRETCLSDFNAKSTAGAQVLIVTTFKKGLSGFSQATGEPENEFGEGWGAYDCGLAGAYLVLAAREMGMDTLIMGIRNEEKIRQFLSLPEDEITGPVIGLGYRAEEPAFRPRKELDEIASFY